MELHTGKGDVKKYKKIKSTAGISDYISFRTKM